VSSRQSRGQSVSERPHTVAAASGFSVNRPRLWITVWRRAKSWQAGGRNFWPVLPPHFGTAATTVIHGKVAAEWATRWYDGRSMTPLPDSSGRPAVPVEPHPTLALLERVRRGDRSAIDGLLERHRTAIRRMIDRRMDRVVQRRVDASDIVQDVLLEANRRLGDYLANPTMPFQLWLRHMARDRLIDAHRRHRVASTRSVDREVPLAATGDDDGAADPVAGLADRELTPAAAATWRELERRFAAAVERLDEADREIVLLRHFEHLSTAEAAEALSLSKPAAGMRYLRAMRRLREFLE
jgi:RNA polymerase sigma-70 factor (ECF subfamily)